MATAGDRGREKSEESAPIFIPRVLPAWDSVQG